MQADFVLCILGVVNKVVLMSGADYFTDDQAINVLMNSKVPADTKKAVAEHELIKKTLIDSGVTVHQVKAPKDCQDGVYTANWALVKDGQALMARLPNTRRPEEPHALKAIEDLGIKPITLPPEINRFSGQGDSLICGNIIFTQSPYRTVKEAHKYLKDIFGFEEVIELETLPAYDESGRPIINKITGLPDSPTYDIDLAIAILKPPMGDEKGLIAWCPEVFMPESRNFMENHDKVDKIAVSKKEALEAYALNLLSTGETVIMNAGAPELKKNLEKHGLIVKTLNLPELRKGGGSIRCSTLTLDN